MEILFIPVFMVGGFVIWWIISTIVTWNDPQPNRGGYLQSKDLGHLKLDSSGLPQMRLRRNKNELVLADDMTGHFVKHRNPQLRKLGIIGFNVRGTGYYLAAGKRAQLKHGDQVLLVPEDDNEFDPKAVAVMSVKHKEIIGYVNKGLTGVVRRKLAEGEPVEAISLVDYKPTRNESGPLKVILASTRVMNHLRRKL